MRYNMYRGMLVCALSFCIFSPPSFALNLPKSVWTTDGVHYCIKDSRGIMTTDVDIAYIRRNAQHYHSFYWETVYTLAKGSVKQWRKHRGIK